MAWAISPAAQASPAGKKPGGEDPLGTWRGDSKCVVRPSGCHDEDSVYRVSAVAGASDRVVLSGNKAVDGKEVNMGSGECRYQAKTGALDCPLPNGSTIHLEVKGDAMQGTMSLRDGTLWRKISLRRAKE